MTESEYLASDDPAAMLRLVTENPDHQEIYCCRSDRKLRLFAVAVSRRLGMHTNQRLSAVEAWADGGPVPEQDVFSYEARSAAVAAARVADDAYALSYTEGLNRGSVRMARAMKAALLREIVGNPFRPVTLPPNPDCSACRGSGTFLVGSGEDAERMRCRCCPWLTSTVLSLAQTAYDHRDNSTGQLDSVRLAILADALEEAGCPVGDDPPKTLHKCPHCGSPGRYCSICYGTSTVLAACGTCLDKKRIWTGMDGMKWYPCGVCPKPTPHPILAHLRGPGPHARGCHVIDLLTGRE